MPLEFSNLISLAMNRWKNEIKDHEWRLLIIMNMLQNQKLWQQWRHIEVIMTVIDKCQTNKQTNKQTNRNRDRKTFRLSDERKSTNLHVGT